jgi:hypothetical protein
VSLPQNVLLSIRISNAKRWAKAKKKMVLKLIKMADRMKIESNKRYKETLAWIEDCDI